MGIDARYWVSARSFGLEGEGLDSVAVPSNDGLHDGAHAGRDCKWMRTCGRLCYATSCLGFSENPLFLAVYFGLDRRLAISAKAYQQVEMPPEAPVEIANPDRKFSLYIYIHITYMRKDCPIPSGLSSSN